MLGHRGKDGTYRMKPLKLSQIITFCLIPLQPVCGFPATKPSGSSPAEPQPKHAHGKERADRVEQRIVRRSAAAGHERLVDFIHHGISCRAEECRKAPRPPPAFAVAAHTAVEQQAKDKIFRKVRAFTDEMVDELKLVVGQRRNNPAQDGFEHRSRMLRRKSIRGRRENDARPQ